MKSKSGVCQVSGEYCESIEEHHIIPREFGGENGPTIMLSPTIHQTLHRVYNDNSRLESFASKYPQSGKVLYQLASTLRQCHEKFEKVDNGKVTVNFSPDELQVLKENANKLGISVPSLVKRLIQKLLAMK